MTAPTPRSAAPSDVRRLQAVEEVLAALEGSEDAPLQDQVERLDDAQAALSRILNNDPGVGQPGIPGVAR